MRGAVAVEPGVLGAACATVSPAPFGLMTPAVAVHGAADPVSKPGLPSIWRGGAAAAPALIVQVNDALAVPAGRVVHGRVRVNVPAVVGVPLMTPVEALIDRPVGRPVAENVYGGVPPLADSVRLTAVPTVPVWLPGLASAQRGAAAAAVNAAVPFGVPRPVGPSQPVPAVQIGAPQVPLVPLVTSNRLPGCAYGYDAG